MLYDAFVVLCVYMRLSYHACALGIRYILRARTKSCSPIGACAQEELQPHRLRARTKSCSIKPPSLYKQSQGLSLRMGWVKA